MKSMERNTKNQSNRLAQKKIVKGHKFANKNPNEEVEQVEEGVSKAKIDTLRKQFSTLGKIKPDSLAHRKMTKDLEGRSVKELEGIAKAKIRFLSQTAAIVLQDKHGVKLKFGDGLTAHARYWMESVEHLDELTQREKEMIADRKAKRATKAGRKDKKTRLIPKTTTYVRPSKGEDDHIVMQLRKAQDSANFGNGEFEIRVSPVKGAATVNLKKPQIDKLLNVYDKLEKPDQKRKYRITLLKTLRSMQQKGK
jgi:hypothetical protein